MGKRKPTWKLGDTIVTDGSKGNGDQNCRQPIGAPNTKGETVGRKSNWKEAMLDCFLRLEETATKTKTTDNGSLDLIHLFEFI